MKVATSDKRPAFVSRGNHDHRCRGQLQIQSKRAFPVQMHTCMHQDTEHASASQKRAHGCACSVCHDWRGFTRVAHVHE
eukprot:6191643-Pleurochrysis_carterae.AAC.2